MKKLKNNTGGIIATIFFAIIIMFANTSFADEQTEGEKFVDSVMERAAIVIVDTEQDYLQKWMTKLFGEYVLAPYGGNESGDTTVLLELLTYTNVLALCLGLIIISHTAFAGLLNSAGTGHILGKSWSSYWVPFRTALGLSLIMPTMVGTKAVLSMAQILVIHAILFGSGMGTIAWTAGVDMLFGTKSISNPRGEVKRFVSNGDVVFDVANVKKMYNQLICTESSIRFQTNNQEISSDRNNIKRRLIAEAIDYKGKRIDKIVATEKYPSNTAALTMGRQDFTRIFNNPDTYKVRFANGKCGEATMSGVMAEYKNGDIDYINEEATLDNFNPFNTDSWNKKENNASYKEIILIKASQESFRQIGKIYNELMPVAMSMSYHSSIDRDKFPYRDKGFIPLGGTLAAALNDPKRDGAAETIAGYNYLVEYLRQATQRINDNFIKDVAQSLPENKTVHNLQKEMKKGGWIMAGVWYHQLSSGTDIVGRAIDDVIKNLIKDEKRKFSSKKCTPDDKWFSKDTSCEEIIRNYILLQSASAQLFEDIGVQTKSINNSLALEADKCNADIDSCTFPTDISSKFGARWAKSILNSAAAGYSNKDPFSEKNGGSANPFVVLSKLGHTANQAAFTGFALSGIIYGIVFSLEDVNPGGPFDPFGLSNAALKAGLGVLIWVGLQIFSVFMLFMSSGFMLAYVIPFLPIITWIMMSIGYLLTIIEAICAAPLAVIMMVSPEGEGISGSRTERAMQMTMAITLLPTLMVIGVFASISLGYVGFEILNVMFWKSATLTLDIHQIKTSESYMSAPVTGIFDFFAIFVIYVGLCFKFCEYIVQVMHKIPNSILEWMAGGLNRQFGEQEAGQMAQQSMGTMKQGFQTLSSGSQGQVSSLLNRKYQAKMLSAKNKGDEDSGGGGNNRIE